MAQFQQRANAFICPGNPEKWTDLGGGMHAYLEDTARYVYWSTPPKQCRHDEIAVGSRAYIWRTKSGLGTRGIIAVGEVAEAPKLYRRETFQLFEHPERLKPPDWSEQAAASEWKTGIRISEVRLGPGRGMLPADILEAVTPKLNILKNPRGTVFRVFTDQCAQIEKL